jgi:starch phosphorylase
MADGHETGHGPAGVGPLQPFEPGLFDPIIQAIRSPTTPGWSPPTSAPSSTPRNAPPPPTATEPRWARMSMLNTACSGKFSTDRTMLEYNKEIWKLKQLPEMPLT